MAWLPSNNATLTGWWDFSGQHSTVTLSGANIQSITDGSGVIGTASNVDGTPPHIANAVSPTGLNAAYSNDPGGYGTLRFRAAGSPVDYTGTPYTVAAVMRRDISQGNNADQAVIMGAIGNGVDLRPTYSSGGPCWIPNWDPGTPGSTGAGLFALRGAHEGTSGNNPYYADGYSWGSYSVANQQDSANWHTWVIGANVIVGGNPNSTGLIFMFDGVQYFLNPNLADGTGEGSNWGEQYIARFTQILTSDFNNTTFGWTGEILVFNSLLSLADAQNASTYLGSKWITGASGTQYTKTITTPLSITPLLGAPIKTTGGGGGTILTGGGIASPGGISGNSGIAESGGMSPLIGIGSLGGISGLVTSSSAPTNITGSFNFTAPVDSSVFQATVGNVTGTVAKMKAWIAGGSPAGVTLTGAYPTVMSSPPTLTRSATDFALPPMGAGAQWIGATDARVNLSVSSWNTNYVQTYPFSVYPAGYVTNPLFPNSSAQPSWYGNLLTQGTGAYPFYVFDFMHTGSRISFYQSGNGQTNVLVNGQLVSQNFVPTDPINYSYSQYWVTLDFGGVRATRRIQWFTYAPVVGINGFAFDTADTVAASANTNDPLITFMGDSYMASTAGKMGGYSFCTQMAASFITSKLYASAVGGTGYRTTNYPYGSNYTTRLGQTAPNASETPNSEGDGLPFSIVPDIHIVAGGINDYASGVPTVTGDASGGGMAYCLAARSNWPNAIIVIVGPWCPNQHTNFTGLNDQGDCWKTALTANPYGAYTSASVASASGYSVPFLSGPWIYIDNLHDGWVNSNGASGGTIADTGTPWVTGDARTCIFDSWTTTSGHVANGEASVNTPSATGTYSVKFPDGSTSTATISSTTATTINWSPAVSAQSSNCSMYYQVDSSGNSKPTAGSYLQVGFLNSNITGGTHGTSDIIISNDGTHPSSQTAQIDVLSQKVLTYIIAGINAL